LRRENMPCSGAQLLVLLVAFPHVAAWTLTPPSRATRAPRRASPLLSESGPAESAAPEEAAEELAPPAAPRQYDVTKLTGSNKEEGGGAGFNQFDPVLTATGFISRRFGLVGGLGLVALLAAVEGKEIVGAFFATGPEAGSGEVITTASGLQYVDILIAKSGDSPLVGNLVGFNAKVSIGDKVLLDTAGGKPVAFKFGQRPFQNVVCEGLEEGVKNMKVGGKRKLLVPQSLAPPGVQLPDGVPLTYEIELTEVLPNYLQ